MGTINGFTLGYTAAGAVVMWSGIKGWSISATFRALLTGSTPATSTETIPGLGGAEGTATTSAAGTVANTASENTSGSGDAANQAIGLLLAAPYGWSAGTEWDDLVSLWDRESGWNNTATNASSGAYGIAQALGHGDGAATQGTVTNEYGGYGVSDSVAQDANSGSASAQITWGLAYIEQTYGSPSAAWAHEESAGYY